MITVKLIEDSNEMKKELARLHEIVEFEGTTGTKVDPVDYVKKKNWDIIDTYTYNDLKEFENHKDLKNDNFSDLILLGEWKVFYDDESLTGFVSRRETNNFGKVIYISRKKSSS